MFEDFRHRSPQPRSRIRPSTLSEAQLDTLPTLLNEMDGKLSAASLAGDINAGSGKLTRRSRSFREMFCEIFAHFSCFSYVFERFGAYSDMFGCIRIQSDAFLCAGMRSDTSGNFQIFRVVFGIF